MDAAALRTLEAACLASSATPRTRVVDGWIVRLAPGKAKRARSINPFDPSSASVDAQLARCAPLYAEAGLPLIVRITPCVHPADLDDQLAARGFARFEPTAVMSRALTGAAEPADPRVEPVGLADLVAGVGALRGSPADHVEAHHERLAALPLTVQGLVVRDPDGSVAAAGLAILDLPFVGLFDIVTAPARRGHGLGTAVTRALVAWGQAAGATTAYLQVDVENPPARAIYHRLGFVDRYAYWYRVAP